MCLGRIKEDERLGAGMIPYEESERSHKIMDEQDLAGEGDKVQVYLWKGAVSIKALSLGGPERIEGRARQSVRGKRGG